MIRYWIILLFMMPAASYTAGGQALGFEISDHRKRVKIPFELYGNLIVVPVILNHKLPLKFILDTGVRTTILTQKTYSDFLNLSYVKKYTIAGIGDEAAGIEAYVTNGVSLTLPGIHGSGHSMLVLEDDYLKLRNYLGTEVHGVLGYELFSRFVVKVDYDRKMLTITTPEHFRAGKKYNKLAITVEDTKPYIIGKLTYTGEEEEDVKLMADSGASHGLMLDCRSDERIRVPDNYLTSYLGRGLAGEWHGKVGRISRFAVGNTSWDDVLVTFPDENSLLDSLKATDVFRNGSIGGAILSRFKVIFNFPEEAIYLKKGVRFNDPFDHNLSGITVKAKGSTLRTFEITEVRAGSPAETAGLYAGDIITEINYINAGSLNLEQITGILREKQNKTVHLKVTRNGKIIKTKFRLKRFI